MRAKSQTNCKDRIQCGKSLERKRDGSVRSERPRNKKRNSLVIFKEQHQQESKSLTTNLEQADKSYYNSLIKLARK